MLEVVRLKNGMKVVLERCASFHSVSFGVWVKAGSRNENKQNNGIAHMTEHMLFKGTEKRSAAEIARITAMLGGNLNAYTSKECTSYYCKTLPSMLETAIELIGDMLCHSKIDEEDLEHEKSVVCDEIDMYDDSAEDYVHEVLQKKVYKKHPLGYLISGKKKVVRSFQAEDIKNFVHDYYVGENMIISIAGNFQKEKVLEWLERAFADIQPKGREILLTTPVYTQSSFVKEKEMEQLHLNMVFPSVSFRHEDRYAVTLLNNILGGDVNSRLFQEIREKRGITYNICSYGSSFSDTGLLHIYAAMNQNQENIVRELIFEVLEDLRKNGITEEELEAAKQQSVVEMTLNRDNSGSRMNANAKALLFDDRLYSFQNVITKLKQTSRETVMDAIIKYLDFEKVSIGIVKNETNSKA